MFKLNAHSKVWCKMIFMSAFRLSSTSHDENWISSKSKCDENCTSSFSRESWHCLSDQLGHELLLFKILLNLFEFHLEKIKNHPLCKFQKKPISSKRLQNWKKSANTRNTIGVFSLWCLGKKSKLQQMKNINEIPHMMPP